MSRQFRGMLAAYKPRGMISKDLSRWIERQVGKQKLGHVGTLDPMAEGVLCLLFGSATRLQDQLLELPKTYLFDMKLGMETDTLDLDGKVLSEVDATHMTREAIAALLPGFRGRIKQVPPVFSAVKYQGRPLYDYARKNQDSDVPVDSLAREVTVEHLEIKAFEPGLVTLEARCSKGTYIRSLVRDIARAAGTTACLSRLVRTEASGIRADACASLEQIETAIKAGPGNFEAMLLPPEKLALGLPVWQSVEHDCCARLRRGQQVSVSSSQWLENLRTPHPSTTGAMTLMLIDPQGVAFGLGEAKMTEGGRFLITMKRGLS
ncbi:MAG: hypothetical protein RIQ81_1226 [Pseudomonadota bacterium]|jgi:tRNA pseudouridine55 synthase